MMYPYRTLTDGTEIVHSHLMERNGTECLEVYFERPIDNGFASARCVLPSYQWISIDGFSAEEMKFFNEFLKSAEVDLRHLAEVRAINQRKADMQAEMKSDRDQGVRDMAKLIYAAARNLDDRVSMQMIREAESEEERLFYVYIHDMNLQRRQKIVIKNNVF